MHAARVCTCRVLAKVSAPTHGRWCVCVLARARARSCLCFRIACFAWPVHTCSIHASVVSSTANIGRRGALYYQAALDIAQICQMSMCFSSSHARASSSQEWMRDFDKFEAALRADTTYMSTLTRSMSLMLDEFYATLSSVGKHAF